MKKYFSIPLLTIALAFFAGPTIAQLRKIPAEVTEALKSKYPEAASVAWKDKISAFSASFELNGEKYEARFSSKGDWQYTEKEIAENDLPAEVKDGLNKSKYADWQLRTVYNIDLPDNKLQFRIQVSKSDLQKKNLFFSSEGQLLKDNITL
jgi:hypothetical protein